MPETTKKTTPTKKTNAEKAQDIMSIITTELNLRVGIGPIWRQLHQTRKSEIIDKCTKDIAKYLEK